MAWSSRSWCEIGLMSSPILHLLQLLVSVIIFPPQCPHPLNPHSQFDWEAFRELWLNYSAGRSRIGWGIFCLMRTQGASVFCDMEATLM